MSGHEHDRPLIAVTTWRRELPTYLGERTDLITLGAEYAQAVQRAGGVPILISEPDEAAVDQLVRTVDGILLSGGGDVAPAAYGGATAGAAEVDPRRDAAELAVVAAARRYRRPLFGICRGLQILNVACGGSLVPDLPTTSDHPRPSEPEGRLALRHAITATRDWPLAGLDRDAGGRASVNSIHHQAIDRLGVGLTAVAWSGDGVVEAVEGAGDWFVRAVQWHPEKMRDPNEQAHASALFADFLAAVPNRRVPQPAVEQEYV
jgi:putative glutamine amidotransferase